MFYDCIQPFLLHGLTKKQPLADVSTLKKKWSEEISFVEE